MKKYFIWLLLVSIFILTACGESKNSFKEDYESINGKENKSGKIHRVVTIPEDNVFEEVDAKKIVKMIDDKETFYVYFGSRLCPWCRSVIEKACEIANLRGISKIYYVDIWDDEGNEILRDTYILDDANKPVLEKAGTEGYQKLLGYFDAFLRDYTLSLENGKTINVGEKRIYAPNFIYVEKGTIKKLVTGKSDNLTDSRGKLTEEILQDEEKIFDDFFTEACDDAC